MSGGASPEYAYRKRRSVRRTSASSSASATPGSCLKTVTFFYFLLDLPLTGLLQYRRNCGNWHHPKRMIGAGDGEKTGGARSWRGRTTRDPLPRETRHPCLHHLEQALAVHYRAHFFAALHTEFLIDAAHLGLDGVDGDDQRLGDLRVGVASHQQAQHPLLLCAESREWRGGNGLPLDQCSSQFQGGLGKGAQGHAPIRFSPALPVF